MKRTKHSGAKECGGHRGEPVRVGKFTIFLGGSRDLEAHDLHGYDCIIALTEDLPSLPRLPVTVWNYSLEDYGGVPKDWKKFLGLVIQRLNKEEKLLAFCHGSHGRTGTFLASLIALVEPGVQDPVKEARRRHCKKSVESEEQVKAIFALRGEKIPKKYKKEFYTPPISKYKWSAPPVPIQPSTYIPLPPVSKGPIKRAPKVSVVVLPTTCEPGLQDFIGGGS